jgi:multidrug efflux pump
MAQLAKNMPDGLDYAYANDSSDFIRLSVHDVEKSLLEAIVLVVIVMFVFLQNWRALLVPAVAVPVVLLGTLAVFSIFGYSINTLTLFGLVLAIGLLVDDAIVVVENVERLMRENPGMSAKEATLISMRELQTALIAIALVLCAVFLPMAFFGGSTGVIYRQFSLTIISAMTLSVLVALILSPALTSTVLKAHPAHGAESRPSYLERRFPGAMARVHGAQGWFNRNFENLIQRYAGNVERVVDRKWLFLAIYGVIGLILVLLFVRLPGGFLPTEDEGRVAVQWRLPAGATQTRTLEVRDMVEKYLTQNEKKNAGTVFLVAGGGGGGASGQNTGQGFVNLKPWDERPGKENTADAIAQRATAAFRGLRDAQVFTLVPGAVRVIGDT